MTRRPVPPQFLLAQYWGHQTQWHMTVLKRGKGDQHFKIKVKSYHKTPSISLVLNKINIK